MSKLFPLLISLIILLQSFGLNLSDVSQIDEFIEHAQFHNEQYEDNVLIFISKHYGELKIDHEKEHQEEKKDHEQLPFKQLSHFSSITAFVLTSNKTEFRSPEFLEFKLDCFFYKEPISSLHKLGLFQPPRQS